MRRNVALLLFNEVEVLDFAGPFEVFAVTDELAGHALFNVFTVAATPGPVRARNGLVVQPAHTFATAPAADVLIVPGGFGTRALLHDEPVLTWLRTAAASAEIVMSVCTGSIVLGRAGLLDGLRATTHYACLDLLRTHAPRATVVPSVRWTDNGKILTSAGIAAGIDCSLHLVGRLLGADTAAATARYMEYPLNPSPGP